MFSSQVLYAIHMYLKLKMTTQKPWIYCITLSKGSLNFFLQMCIVVNE